MVCRSRKAPAPISPMCPIGPSVSGLTANACLTDFRTPITQIEDEDEKRRQTVNREPRAVPSPHRRLRPRTINPEAFPQCFPAQLESGIKAIGRCSRDLPRPGQIALSWDPDRQSRKSYSRNKRWRSTHKVRKAFPFLMESRKTCGQFEHRQTCNQQKKKCAIQPCMPNCPTVPGSVGVPGDARVRGDAGVPRLGHPVQTYKWQISHVSG
jgi:hypothetical protein